MKQIKRLHTNERMSQIVINNETIYLSGQVGTPGDSFEEQTKTCLEKIEKLLFEAGSDKENILQTIIWLADISNFDKLNEIWDAWTIAGSSPARACGEAKLAKPELKIEITVTAATKRD